MEEILKTTLLEYEKSAFLIDLVKHPNGKQYVSILQTIQEDGSGAKRAIKINPSLLSDIINVLNSYLEDIPGIKDGPAQNSYRDVPKTSFTVLSESQKVSIQNRYLRGVSLSELMVQFDCEEELIRQILNNNGIFILEPKIKKVYRNSKRRR